MAYEFGESIFDQSIEQWFVIRRLPEGTAPEHIREQWFGIPLPLRQPKNMDSPEPRTVFEVTPDNETGAYRMVNLEDGTKVLTNDALKALRLFGRLEAFDWWVDYQRRTGSGALYFGATEGQYMSPSTLEAVLPGINQFDSLA